MRQRNRLVWFATVICFMMIGSSGFVMAHMPGPLIKDVAYSAWKYVHLGSNYSDTGTTIHSEHRHVWMQDWSQTTTQKYRVAQYYDVDGTAGVQNIYHGVTWMYSGEDGPNNPAYCFCTTIDLTKAGPWVVESVIDAEYYEPGKYVTNPDGTKTYYPESHYYERIRAQYYGA